MAVDSGKKGGPLKKENTCERHEEPTALWLRKNNYKL